MIRVINANKSFGSQRVLKDLSVEFEPGKTNLVIGSSGSGKTILLKSIIGLSELDSGEIWYADTCFNKLDKTKKKEIRKGIGMLFQGSALFDSMTVEQNVSFKLDIFTTLSKAAKKKRVDECLEKVNIRDAGKLLPNELSGGMKKRVAIARAIALYPSYLFCDEPNSGLDPKTAILIDKLIQEITKEFHMTTIVNTHDMNSVLEIGEKVMFIRKGSKLWEGSKADIFNTDNQDLNKFVFATNLARQFKKDQSSSSS